MTLIIILLACLVDHFIFLLGDLRNFSWLSKYYFQLEKHGSRWSVWDGPTGVLIVVGLPMLLFLMVYSFIQRLHISVDFLFSLLILILCLGPKNLFHQVNDYLLAEEEGDTESAHTSAALINNGSGHDIQDSGFYLIESILLQSNRRLFAVLFWFIMLGPFGAVLYRLVSELLKQLGEIHSSFVDSLYDLYCLLNWPASRLLATGFALAGSLVHAVEEWRLVDNGSIYRNDGVIRATGLGAVQFDEDFENLADWVDEIHGLVKRTLVLWLAILGVMTLSGWLG